MQTHKQFIRHEFPNNVAQMVLRKAKKREENAVVGRKTKSSKFSVLTMSEPANKKSIWEGCNKKGDTKEEKR